jgi:hypothetical protein
MGEKQVDNMKRLARGKKIVWNKILLSYTWLTLVEKLFNTLEIS